MKKYKIEITETLQRTIDVKAANDSEAITKARNLYFDEKIVLDYNNYIDTKFDAITN